MSEGKKSKTFKAKARIQYDSSLYLNSKPTEGDPHFWWGRVHNIDIYKTYRHKEYRQRWFMDVACSEKAGVPPGRALWGLGAVDWAVADSGAGQRLLSGCQGALKRGAGPGSDPAPLRQARGPAGTRQPDPKGPVRGPRARPAGRGQRGRRMTSAPHFSGGANTNNTH